jgi:hypothetical protein
MAAHGGFEPQQLPELPGEPQQRSCQQPDSSMAVKPSDQAAAREQQNMPEN